MDINLYIEGLRQSQEKTSRQKDILDTWEEIQKVPFDRQTAIKQAKKNKLNYSAKRKNFTNVCNRNTSMGRII